MGHTRIASPGLLLGAAILLAAPVALAQTAGHYQGTNNEGYEVDIYVDTSSGSPVISSFGDAGTVYCRGSSFSEGYGVGYGGFNTPITNGMATFDYISSNVYTNATFNFKGKNVKGSMVFGVPLFPTTTEPPKKGAACLTKQQTYTAAYVGSETRVSPKKSAIAAPIVTK